MHFLNYLTPAQLKFISLFGVLGLIIAATFFSPVSDEQNWVKAGKHFQDAIFSFNPAATYDPKVSHRLGVSVLWVSSLIYTFFSGLSFENLIIIHRLVFLIINLSIFTICLKILRFHASTKSLVLLTVFMILNRFFPLIGRSTWLDQLITMLGFLLIILWTNFLFQNKSSTILKAGFLNGLLMLTKYAGWFFSPIILGLSAIYCYRFKKSLKSKILPIIIFIFLSLLVFVIFYPAVWVDPYKALFLRLEDNNTLIRKSGDIWEYLSEIKLINPSLITGTIFVIWDYKKRSKDFIHFIGLGGVLYLAVFLVIFLLLILKGRLDYPFLQGVYRYTFPAIPILAFYTFERAGKLIKNKDWVFGIFLFLFVWEIIFSPFLIFR